jgi:hypothetical protein
VSHARLVAQACSTLQHRIAIISIISRFVRFRLQPRQISMRQSLEIIELGQQSNPGTSFRRSSMKRPESPGTARFNEDFICKPSNDNAPVSARRTSSSISSRQSAVKIFVVYDSDLSRDRARHMEKDLARRLGCCFDFSVSSWKLKSLWHPKMVQMAANAAAKAEIVLFSLVSGGELPQAVKNWLGKVLINNPAHKVCLLALLETGGNFTPRLSPAEVYVSNLSSKIGVDCLCYSDSIPLARLGRHKWQRKREQSRQRIHSAPPKDTFHAFLE